METADFLPTVGIYNTEIYSDVKDARNQYVTYQNQADAFVHNTNASEHNLRVGLFDIGKDMDDAKTDLTAEQFLVNSSATDDESMAVEALRQLGNCTVYPNASTVARIETKTPQVLPLLPCYSCPLEFRTTADLNDHLSICKHTQFKCQVCSKSLEGKSDLSTHILSHLEDQYSCRICSSQFKDKKELSAHMLTHGNITLANQCPVCGNLFNRPSSLTNHMKIHTYQAGRAILNIAPKILDAAQLSNILGSEVNENVNKKVPLPSLNSLIWNLCYDTNEQNNFNVNLDVGVGSDIGLDNKDFDMYVDNKKSLDQVISGTGTFVASPNDKKPHVCVHCTKSFTREKALLSHLKLHSDLFDCYYQCDMCEKNFNDENSLQKHQVLCSTSAQAVSGSDDVKVVDLKFALSVDQMQLNNKSNKINMTKTKVNKHGCEECGKFFSTRQKLGRHMWIHRKKIHSCEICLDSFEKQDDLDSHRLSSHYKSSPYVCTECGKNFSSRQGLWEHNRIHGDESNLYKCSECLKTFSSRQGYLIHKRKHSDERPYGCRFCWKTFRDGGTLRKHERIHTGERPHACPLCGKAFNQKVVLREHVRWLHTANKQPNEQDGLYHCSLCELKVSDKEVLCAHIVKHSDRMALVAKDNSKIGRQESEGVAEKRGSFSKLKKKGDEVREKIDTGSTDGDVLNFIQQFVDIESAVECDLCGDKFLNKTGLSEHIRIHI